MYNFSKFDLLHIVALLIIGICIGLLSSLTFHLGFSAYESENYINNWLVFNPKQGNYYGILPGFFFGTGVGSLYLYVFQNKVVPLKLFWILSGCTVCYLISRWLYVLMYILLLYLMTLFDINGKWLENTLLINGFLPFVPAFVATYAMMCILEKQMACFIFKNVILISLLGGSAASLFMVLSLLSNHAMNLYYAQSFYIFFIGWQVVMLIAVGFPILKLNLKKITHAE